MGVLEYTVYTSKYNSSLDPLLSFKLSTVYNSIYNTMEMFSWAANQYYILNNKASSFCNLNGLLIL